MMLDHNQVVNIREKVEGTTVWQGFFHCSLGDINVDVSSDSPSALLIAEKQLLDALSTTVAKAETMKSISLSFSTDVKRKDRHAGRRAVSTNKSPNYWIAEVDQKKSKNIEDLKKVQKIIGQAVDGLSLRGATEFAWQFRPVDVWSFHMTLGKHDEEREHEPKCSGGDALQDLAFPRVAFRVAERHYSVIPGTNIHTYKDTTWFLESGSVEVWKACGCSSESEFCGLSV